MTENNFRFEKRNIYYNDKILVQVDNDIQDYLLTDNLLIILTDGEQASNDQNVYCYDLTGDFLWQIEDPDHLHSRNYFTSIYLSNKDELQAYNINGVEYTIKKQTGSILRKELIK